MSDEGNDVDVHVGARIRQLRSERGITEEQLASAIGESADQVRSFELGAARVGASRLSAIARVLDVPVAAFFEALQPDEPAKDDRPTVH